MLNPRVNRGACSIITSLITLLIFSCSSYEISTDRIDYRREMKTIINEIAVTSRAKLPEFEIIVNNGEELVTRRGTATSRIDSEYLSLIDGFLVESLFYGYSGLDRATPVDQRNTMLPYLRKLTNASIQVMVIDYCSLPENRADSLRRNHKLGFMAYPSPRRELDVIPDPVNVPIDFLYLVNPGRFDTLDELESSLIDIDTQIIVLDLYFAGALLPRDTIERIREGANSRKVYAYMSVGEASSWRYYWSSTWNFIRPKWIAEENPFWPGSFRVYYWEDAWKDLLFHNRSSYLARILAAGFDGIVLDGVDTYQYFEELDS